MNELTKEDFDIFTKEELVNLITDLLNRMEKDGNRYMNEYKSTDRSEFYTYAAALLTRVNFVKAKVSLKYQNKNEIQN